MMSMRSITFAVMLALVLSMYPVLAGYATAIPKIVSVPIKGSANVTLIINLTANDGIGYTHEVLIKIYNLSTNQLSDKLNLSVVSPVTSFGKQSTGVYYFTYTPTAPGNYTFNLILSTNNTNPPKVGDSFAIDVTDLYVNLTAVPPIQVAAATIIGAPIVSELTTLALSAIGLASIGLIVRRRNN